MLNKYFLKRITKTSVLLTVIIGLTIAGYQIFQTITPELLKNNIFLESPYTKWLSMDPFNFTPVLFFMILPLLASIPGGAILRSDINSGMLSQVKVRNSMTKVVRGYSLCAFIKGFLIIIIPLILNFTIYFLFLQNIKPDNLLNSNLLVINQNTMLVGLYYNHPMIHALLNILFVAIWSGLFASFATAISFWVKNIFVVVTSGFLLQILLFVLNAVIKLPNNVSYVPIDFLKETAGGNVSIVVTSIVTLLMILTIVVLLKIGGKFKIAW